MTSKLSLSFNENHRKTFDNLTQESIFEYPLRRKSCYCKLCGNLGHFQVQNSNLPTPIEHQFNRQQRNKRKQSFGDDIKTQIPSELSQIESDNGRRIILRKRSISISNMNVQRSLKFEQIFRENNNRTRRGSCECSECGRLNQFQKKNKELSIPKKERKFKQIQTTRQRKFQQYGSTEFQINNKNIIIQKSIIQSSKSLRSFQVKQINDMIRTKDVNKLVKNRISTRDLEQPKQIQNKFSIINSCQQLDSPQIPQVKSQKQNIHKPVLSFSNIKQKFQ
ncbi:unnamed protein product [Paramecium sonneborni]|uniref:Uncharacterized protein n=1 Tax=Paramecium sonneborni TaxID=65129 RepID=A0A8S1QNT6_9CILI|nr:unnamed protein product [Paramecium sonneborni]